MKLFNKQVTNVFITNDYSKFKSAKTNRVINKQVVLCIQAIMAYFAKVVGIENAFIGCIVVVKRKDGLYILDGQHRFEAARGSGVPVRYEVREMSEEDFNKLMIKLNTSSHSWTTIDYANSHSQSSNGEVEKIYSVLLKLKSEYKLTFSNLCHIIQGNKSLDKFKEGTLEMTSLPTIKKRIKMLLDYREQLNIDKAFVLRNLIDVIIKPEYAKNHDRMLSALNKLNKLNKLNVDKEVTFKNTLNKTFNEICKPKVPMKVVKVRMRIAA